jgi:hypothetical protein
LIKTMAPMNCVFHLSKTLFWNIKKKIYLLLSRIKIRFCYSWLWYY